MARKFRPNHVKINREMSEQKVSAEAIARAAGHSDGSYIRRMRKGEKRAQSATLQTAEAVARMLGLPLDYLFVEVDPRTGKDLSTSESSESPGSEHVA